MVPDLKWQLIKEQIVKQFDIHVDDADLLALAKRVAASQFAQYGVVVSCCCAAACCSCNAL